MSFNFELQFYFCKSRTLKVRLMTPTNIPNPTTDKPKFFRTKGHLLLCQNGNCQSRGAALLHSVLTRNLEQHHLIYYKSGGTLRYTTSGCLGACSFGPIMACYRNIQDGEGNSSTGLEEAWYSGVTLPLALEVAQAIQHNRPWPSQNRFDLANLALERI